jgi:hypothetical protein
VHAQSRRAPRVQHGAPSALRAHAALAQAEGWEHRVLPVRRGSRRILKLAFTSTTLKLPAYEANLAREAYSAY